MGTQESTREQCGSAHEARRAHSLACVCFWSRACFRVWLQSARDLQGLKLACLRPGLVT